LYQGLPGLLQMLPRHSTPLALLLVMLGMFWLGDACCDNLEDSSPVGAGECLRCSVDTPNKQHNATASFELVVEFEKHVSVGLARIFAPVTTALTRLRSQKQTVRAPPVFFA
jgi:hypothetical protein